MCASAFLSAFFFPIFSFTKTVFIQLIILSQLKITVYGNRRNSWINIINPFRGLLVIGSPGAGKSWFIIQHVIKQHIEKRICNVRLRFQV